MTGQYSRLRPLLRWRTIRWALAAVALPPLLWACNSHPLMEPLPVPETQTDLNYEINPGRQLDLLFMVDNSDSMVEEQENLARNFPLLIGELEKIPGGLPDIHIAVISSNFGAGPNVVSPACPVYGDRGRFLVKDGCGLDGSQFHWLEQNINDGTKNFQGNNLATAFGCLARLGVGGCGYEHQLQALRSSLYDVNPENRGFLRPEAYMGIILLSDEDDCSAEPYATFFDEPVPSGQATSLICSTLGHVCNGQEVPAMNGFSAPLNSCKPYERQQNPALDSKPEQDPPRRQRLINVSELVDYVKAKKGGRPDRIIVSAIVGWPRGQGDQNATQAAEGHNYQVGMVMKTTPKPRVELDNIPICETPGTGRATAGVRFKGFIDGFGENGSMYSICQEDLGPSVKAIGETLAKRLATNCITAPLVDKDGNPGDNTVKAECQVSDGIPKADGTYQDTPLPECNGDRNSSTNAPCWLLERDGANEKCGSGFHMVRVNGEKPAPLNALLRIKCLTCTQAASGKTDSRCTH
jgi:hypothetical protein